MAVSKSRRGDFLIPFITVAFDSLAIEFSFLFSYWLRFHSTLFESYGFTRIDAPPIVGYITGSLFVLVVWLLIFQTRSMYGARRSVSISDELINIVKVVSLGMLVVMSVAFFYREFSYSRVVFGLLWVTSIATVSSGRIIVQWFERRLYRKGRNLQYAIIIGNDTLASEVYTHLNGHPSFGFHVIGYFADGPAQEKLNLSKARYLGTVNEAPRYIKEENVELAFIALRAEHHQAMFMLISECEGVNIEFMMVPDILEIMTSRVRVKELEGIPFLRIKSIPLTFWGRIAKRTFDVITSGLLLIALSPAWLVVTLLVRLDSKGPILFRQERAGLDGKRFTMYKFRSMKAGAERLDDEAGLGVANDPRRTRLGVWLRKSSLDELPQLFNVLKGDMSLVGPRPERLRYVEKFSDAVPKYLDRHRMKTGVTGWAQVNGLRGDTSIEERIKYDLYYIENWSLAFDIKILLRTVKAALRTKEVH
jgi:Undecaprenyl-phosphate glucose phosphotransferase